MSWFTIRTIARYEMRTLMRSWFFRIFVGISIFGLGIFNASLNIESSGSPWIFRAIAAAIPYANLIILNLGQAIVAVFLASEFLKQDMKNDTVEVIYVRSMSNGDYILGKTLGILAVFLVLNILILGLGIGFSLISNIASQRILPYLVYPMLISLPTLVFILGLSFFIMVIIKNQAVTFILLLGYIALTIFYLDKKAFHVFDFIAYQVPMMYSSISGFGNLAEILVHRSIYILFGAGLIFFTVHKLHRLPQSRHLAGMPLYLGIIFILVGGLFIYGYLQIKSGVRSFRQQTLDLNNRYADYGRVSVKTCRINLEHIKTKIHAEANLAIINTSNLPLDTLIFSLNEGLVLKSLTFNGRSVSYKREKQIIRIYPASTFFPGDSAGIVMDYAGRINENGCFPEKDPARYEDNFKLMMFGLRKRYAFLQKKYLCLTQELQWYPVSGAGYASTTPFRFEPDFTDYSLLVKTSPGLTAISQGVDSSYGEGSFSFKPEYPLTGISLLIGDYNRYTITVDSVEYSVYPVRGHEYFTNIFNEIKDTLPALIRDLKQEYEIRLGLKYPFNRFILAEVPIHFALDQSNYSYSSIAIQPEIIFYPEKGVVFNSSDFKGELFRRKKNAKNNSEEILPEEIQSDLFKQFIKVNFMSRQGQGQYYDFMQWNTFSLFPEYYSFVTRLQSREWPFFNTVFEAYVSERNNDGGSVHQWYEDLSGPEKINLELSHASLSELLKRGLDVGGKEKDLVSIRDILVAKGNHFFNLLRARSGESRVDTLMTRLILAHQHGIISFDELSSVLEKNFHTNLEKETEKWYKQSDLPGFVITGMETYRIRVAEAIRYQIRFIVTNAENADGLVTLNVEENSPNRNHEDDRNSNIDFSRKIYMPAGTSLEIGFVFVTEPARISLLTHISKNLPYNLIINFPGFTELRNTTPLEGLHTIPLKDDFVGKDETVVDNEDPGFTTHQTTDEAFLKSLVNSGIHKRYKYTSIHSWNPPREWKDVLRSEFYGRYVHSANYTRAGSGERSAVWEARLPEKGSYDVYFFLDKATGVWRRSNKSPDYNFMIYHDQGVEKINRSSADAEDGWNYLGTFSFNPDSARVEMNNKTIGDMIFADAVKWVKR